MLNKDNYNPDPDYLRSLIDQAGISQREAARRLDIDERELRRYLIYTDHKSYLKVPYVVQFALENLV